MSTEQLTQRLFARTEPLRLARPSRLLAILGSILVVGAAWASLATIEEQVRAPGKVIVSSRSQVVQVVDGGVLRKLHVREGDPVKAGDLIAELDTVRFEASSEEIEAKVLALRAAIERGEAELDNKPLDFSEDIEAKSDIVIAQRNLYERRRQFQREEQEAIAASLKLASEELAALEELAKTGDASQTEVLRTRRQVNELRASAVNKRNTYRQETQAELAKNRAELEQALQVLTQKKEALSSTRLKAPMSGTVKNVRITTLGAVLKPGEELLQIVPADDPLLVEAKMRSADVAFVRRDLKANVKLDAWDYTIYGSLEGHVTYISPDTLEDEESRRREEEPTYRVHIQIDEIPKQKGTDRDLDVLPGMTASVAIITGERTVAQYLLKPIRRVRDNSLTER